MILKILVFFILSLISVIVIISLLISLSSKKETYNCSQIDISQLPEVTTECLQGNRMEDLYYLQDKNMVVSSISTNPVSVCLSLCPGYQGNIEECPEEYSNCINSITSPNCVGLLPIARKGAIPYYPLIPGSSLCSNI